MADASTRIRPGYQRDDGQQNHSCCRVDYPRTVHAYSEIDTAPCGSSQQEIPGFEPVAPKADGESKAIHSTKEREKPQGTIAFRGPPPPDNAKERHADRQDRNCEQS